MKKLLPLLLLFISLTTQAQIQLGQDINGEASTDRSGYSVSMPDAYTVAIGATANDGNGTNSGHVRIYRKSGNNWVQKGIDINGESSNDYSGFSVSMPDSITVAIGAQHNSGNGVDAGHVRVYSWSGSAWVKKGLDIDGEAIGDSSGHSLCMPDANTLAIGAVQNDGNGANSGHVRVYRWSGSAWVQKGMDIDGEAANDLSGRSVSMPDSNTIAIGAHTNDGNGINSGHVRIYYWNSNSWVQKGGDIDGESANDISGFTVSMPDSNTVAIGAPHNDGSGTDAGHVRIFSWSGSTWVQKGIDIDGETAGDWSSYSLTMSDNNTVAIGALYNDGNGTDAGHVRIYRWNGSVWEKKGVDINGEATGDQSGFSISMPDNITVAIGARLNDGSGSDAGHVRIYKLTGIQGVVFNDINKNCIKEESGIAVGVKGIIQPGNIFVETNSSGYWYLDSLPLGNYTITYDTSGSWHSTCSNPQSFTVTELYGTTQVLGFGVVNINPCAEPNISVTMPFMRPGFSNQNIYVRACNEKTGTGALTGAYTILELDSLLIPQTSTLSYTNLGNNQYRFELGNINPGECKTFTVACSLSLNAVLGQTLCMEAELFPQPNCVFDSITPAPTPPDFTPCALPWDKSSIKVDGWCKNDSIYFTITNTGELGGGDMDCFSPVRLYIDGIYVVLDSVRLLGREIDTLVFAGNGRTWRLEVDQHPLHPGYSRPNATIERCGNVTNWTPDLVNILPMDDVDPIVDIYCGLVRGSYDPNDKRGFPLGITDTHFVAHNGKMDYMIRFQNTGTDTAFTVVIRDTLDADLDIFSVRSGASSHNYSFRMYGPRVLEWTFNNILLPDSGTNQEGSNGFVTFTVDQVKNLPDFTEINNFGAIYFDFNPPVITNTTIHVVHRKVFKPSWQAKKTISGEDCNAISYNNFNYTKSGSFWQITNDTLLTLNVKIIKSYSSITETACNKYMSPSGKVFTSSNTYLDTIPNVFDCDSIISIDLTVNTSDSSFIDTTLYSDKGATLLVGDTLLTEAGKYTITLTNSKGCDSVVTVNLQIVNGLNNHENSTIKLYPNPTNGSFVLDFGNKVTNANIQITDITGKVVYSANEIKGKQITITLDAPKGFYFVRINLANESRVMKLVRE